MKLTTNDWQGISDALARLDDFTTHGALWGSSEGYGHGYGQLPSEHYESLNAATYVVYSYDTPIAWLVPNGVWVQPTVKYSVTTSRHQGKVAVAIGQLSGAADLSEWPDGVRLTYVLRHDMTGADY